MTTNKTKAARVDLEWEKEAREIMRIRIEKKLARFNMREVGMSEFTRLQRRAPSYKKVIEELKTLPKRENIKDIFSPSKRKEDNEFDKI